MVTHVNRLSCAISNAPGSGGDFTIGSAQTGYRTFGAGQDGQSFSILAVEGSAWEVRTGCVYTHGSTTLTRGTLEDSSTGSAIALTVAAVLSVVPTAGAFGNPVEAFLAAPLSALITTSEALSAGDFVNIWNSSGAKARKADATTAGKEAHGFVLAAVANGASATVYMEGTNDQVSGQTPGVVFLGTTAGAATSTAPSAAGQVVQKLGVAVSATAISFGAQQPIVLA